MLCPNLTVRRFIITVLLPEKKRRGGLSRAYADRMIDGILYIRLGAFNKYTGENIRRTLSENPDCAGVILDLRGNPGGLLSEAVKSAACFWIGAAPSPIPAVARQIRTNIMLPTAAIS